MRRLWRLWRDRRIVHGRHFDVKIEGRWWSPTDRRAAKIAALLCDFSYEQAQEQARSAVRDHVLYGDAFAMARFVPDEWPYPDEDPPDPL